MTRRLLLLATLVACALTSTNASAATFSAAADLTRAPGRMKLTTERPLASSEATARKLVEIASVIEPVQDDRIYIELVNAPFLKMGGSGEQFRAGIALADERGWLELHESGTFVRLTQADSLS